MIWQYEPLDTRWKNIWWSILATEKLSNGLFLKWANPGLFFVYFRSFQTNIIFYNKYMWKNVYPVYDVRIQTHDLWNMSLFP